MIAAAIAGKSPAPGVSVQPRMRTTLIVAADRRQWAQARATYDLDRVMIALPGDALRGHRFDAIYVMEPQTNEAWAYLDVLRERLADEGMLRIMSDGPVAGIDAPKKAQPAR